MQQTFHSTTFLNGPEARLEVEPSGKARAATARRITPADNIRASLRSGFRAWFLDPLSIFH